MSEPSKAARWATRLVLAYLGLTVAAAAYLRVVTFSLRAIEPTRLDSAWQLELVYLADQGIWSGRDFHYARGPLWQGLTWLAKGGPLEASPARVLAAMEASHMLLGIAASVWLTWRVVEAGWKRVVALLALCAVSYAAGISTLRAMLSVAIVVSYLPGDDDQAPSLRRALLPATLTTLGLLYSFDRVPLALSAVVVAVAAEGLARYRRGQSLGPALRRGGYYAGALAATLALVSLVALAVGANPLAYVPAQRRIASAYGALWTGWEAGVRPANIVALVLCAGALALIPLWRKQGRFVEAVWVLSVLPAASFAAIVTDQGHVFVGIAPLLSVLVLWAARQVPEASPAARVAAALLAAVSFAGWFGAYRDALWLRPDLTARALHALRHGTLDDAQFTTQVTPAASWVRAQRERGGLPCIALAPGLTIVHALSRVGGPTLLTLRWTEEQQKQRARELEAARCPYYVHELLAFDEPRGSDWLLGEDFVAIAETYAPLEPVGASSLAMVRRPERVPSTPRSLPSPATGRRLAFDAPGEVAIPLGASVRGEELVELDYTLEAPSPARWLGALPGIEFRFESQGAPVSEYRQLFHAALGRRVRSMVSADSAAAEWRWMAGKPPHREVSADTLRLRFRRLGRLSPERGELVVHGLSALSPPALAPSAPAPECTTRLDLNRELESGRALPRNLAPRPAGNGFEIHPNPPPHHVAEIFFDVRPCADTCLFAELEVRAPPGSGDGVDFEIHLIDRDERPRLLAERVLPGQHLPVEAALWPWAGRSSLLRFGTRNGADLNNDYAVVSRAELGKCSARTGLAEAIRGGWAKVNGSFELRGDDVVLPAEAREIRYPTRISKDTCLSAEADGIGIVETYVVVDAVAHRVDKRRIAAGDKTIGPIGLHDWEGRDVEVVLKSVPDAPFVFVSPRLGRCPEAG